MPRRERGKLQAAPGQPLFHRALIIGQERKKTSQGLLSTPIPEHDSWPVQGKDDRLNVSEGQRNPGLLP